MLGRTALVVGLTNLVAERLIFGEVLLPRYGSVDRIPLLGFVAMYLPVLIGCIALTRLVRDQREAITAGVVAGLVVTAEKFLLAHVGAPGHAASRLLVEPLRYGTLQGARMTFGFLALFLLLHRIDARRRTHADH